MDASLPALLRSSRRDLWILAAVASFVRLIYFAQYAVELPFLYGPIADSVVYLEQAFRIQHGEYGAAVLLAFSPLYGYFLAAIGSASFATIVLVQLLLGVLTCLALYLTTLRVAGRTAARACAALYLGYGTFLYYESKILSETLSLCLGAFALSLYLGSGVRRGRWQASIACGALFALTVLARASLVFAAPLVVGVACLPWSSPRESLSTLTRRAAGVALGFALVFGGNGAWTSLHSGLFVPVILVSRTVEASSSNAYDDRLTSVKFGEGLATSYDVVQSAKRRLAEVQSGAPPAASSAVSIDVIGWLKNAPRKLLKTLSPREITFQYGFNGERDYVSLLRVLPVSFGILLLWGVIGAFVLARGHGLRALLPYAPLMLGVVITTTLYHPSTRYRLAIVLPLLVLSGVGVAGVWNATQSSRRRAVVAVAVALSACTLALSVLHLTSTSYNHAEFELQLAMSAGIQGDMEAQRAHALAAQELAPNDPTIRQRAALLLGQGAQGATTPTPRGP